MLRQRTFHTLAKEARPIISVVAALLTVGFLVFNIYFTQLNTQWTLFLAGVLLAAILAEATRMYRAEWIVMRRTAQLAVLKSKLAHALNLGKQAEAELLEVKQHLYLLDSVLPTMIVSVDDDDICHYHNRAFLEWLHLRPSQVKGKHLREVFGASMSREIIAANRRLLAGHAVQYHREQTMPDGRFYKLSVQHIPKFDGMGKLIGFYMLLSDITRPTDLHNFTQTIFLDEPTIPELTSIDNALSQNGNEEASGDRMMAAIEKGEFRLFSQLIRPLAADVNQVPHYEILIRLLEEEESMMPPGAFFPLAEKYGLMPQLDRWVVRHVIEWIADQMQRGTHIKGSLFFINLANSTLAEAGFPEFVQSILLAKAVAGEHLCFEVPDTEWMTHRANVVRFVQGMQQLGCHIALSGFGQGRVDFEQLKGLAVDFLKIDGSIVLEILRDPVALTKAITIKQYADENGLKTIAEFVEYEDIIDKLNDLGIDFAQGFGISHPLPLAEQFADYDEQ